MLGAAILELRIEIGLTIDIPLNELQHITNKSEILLNL